jgi:hypothetical protein
MANRTGPSYLGIFTGPSFWASPDLRNGHPGFKSASNFSGLIKRPTNWKMLEERVSILSGFLSEFLSKF